MSCAFIADSQCVERFAVRLLLMQVDIEVAGEAADWSDLVARAHSTRAELLLVDWDLLSSQPARDIEELGYKCPGAMITVLISHPDVERQALIEAAGGTFLCKDATLISLWKACARRESCWPWSVRKAVK